MIERCENETGPLVSVLMGTYNRRRYLPVAISSILHQDYSNFEIILINDGGEDVSDIIESFNDPRITFINRKENRGFAATLNEAIPYARGKYICYLGDDDLYYPNHFAILVDALENKTDCHVAYSDLYKTYCRIESDGRREVLAKAVEICRNFDRFLMLFYNHVLHVSLMHRRDLFEKMGMYNEKIQVLIDWDLTRRLAFFTDFYHVHKITGEFYSSVGESDRISVVQRRNQESYTRNLMSIRTTRPPKPWPKIKDLSIIFLADRFDKEAGKTLGLIWRHTFYPYKVYLPLGRSDLSRLNSEMPNLVEVMVEEFANQGQRIDAALAECEGEYVAIVPSGFEISEFWVEDSVHGMINSPVNKEAIELDGSRQGRWAILVKKDELQYARENFANLPVLESLNAAGIVIRRLRPEEIPFQFDQLLSEAESAEKDGKWLHAAEIFEYIAEHYQNELWMKGRAAKAFHEAGSYDKAIELSSYVNREKPTVDTLLLEARANRKQNNFNSAIKLLETAEQILEGKELLWT